MTVGPPRSIGRARWPAAMGQRHEPAKLVGGLADMELARIIIDHGRTSAVHAMERVPAWFMHRTGVGLLGAGLLLQ
jgi:hypothetical protein